MIRIRQANSVDIDRFREHHDYGSAGGTGVVEQLVLYNQWTGCIVKVRHFAFSLPT